MLQGDRTVGHHDLDQREAPADARVTSLKAILTRKSIPPANLVLAINLRTARIVAASAMAIQYKDDIENALAGQ